MDGLSGDSRLIDSTWVMPGARRPVVPAPFQVVPWFDIDLIANQSTTLPHMAPSPDQFTCAMQAFDISSDDPVRIYDRSGVFSSARLWWTFKLMGHADVDIINGGLPRLLEQSHTPVSFVSTPPARKYRPAFQPDRVTDFKAVVAAVTNGSHTIIDARPPGRFSGADPEPRAGLSSGHMPGAINIPYGSLKASETRFKDTVGLVEVFRDIPRNKPVITTCGSGVTAAALAWALDQIGFDAPVAVYDGSWAEYAAKENSIIVKD